MKTILLLFFFIFISGCTKEQRKPETSDTKKDTTSKNIQKSTNTTPQGAGDETSNKNPSLKDVDYTISKVPSDITDYEGKIVAMAKWNDKLGDNILFITETEVKSSGGDNRHKELLVYHYITSRNENKLLWKINDFIKDCPVDITLQYID